MQRSICRRAHQQHLPALANHKANHLENLPFIYDYGRIFLVPKYTRISSILKKRADPDPAGSILTTFDPNKGEFIWLPEEDPVLRNAAGLA